MFTISCYKDKNIIIYWAGVLFCFLCGIVLNQKS